MTLAAILAVVDPKHGVYINGRSIRHVPPYATP